MKNFINIICCYLALLPFLFIGCSENNESVSDPEIDLEMPEWNKKKTLQFHFISTLSDESIASEFSEYQVLDNFFTTKGSHCVIAIVDRADAFYRTKNMYNGIVDVTFNQSKYLAYAPNKIQSDNEIQGTALLLNDWFDKQEYIKIKNDCYAKFINLKLKTKIETPSIEIETPFYTIRFEDSDQLKDMDKLLSHIISQRGLLLGTIKSLCYKDLQTEITQNNKNLRLQRITSDQTSDYTLFLLAYKTWVFRELKQEVLSGNICLHTIAIEANVYY